MRHREHDFVSDYAYIHTQLTQFQLFMDTILDIFMLMTIIFK